MYNIYLSFQILEHELLNTNRLGGKASKVLWLSSPLYIALSHCFAVELYQV